MTKLRSRHCEICGINIDWVHSQALTCPSQICKEERRWIKQRTKDANRDKEQLRAKGRKWAAKNKEKIRQYAKEWRLKHKDKVNEYAKQWRTNNREKARALGREHYYKNREQRLEQSKSYYANNRDKCLELGRLWNLKRTAAVKALRELELI